MTADADGAKGDDGAKGEHDSIGTDVETPAGGDGADRLVGNGNDNWLAGRDGNDVIHGHGGEDTLHGDGGADKLYGGADDDWLDGREVGDLDKVVDLMDGGTHGTIGDSCVARTLVQITGCENHYAVS